MATCMVCNDEESRDFLFKVCSCNTVVHRACFYEMTQKCPAHAEHCAVCLKPYPVVQKGWKLILHDDIWQVATFYYTFLLGAVLLNVGLTLLGDLAPYYKQTRVIFWSITLAMPPYFHILRYARFRVCGCVRVRPHMCLEPNDTSIILHV